MSITAKIQSPQHPFRVLRLFMIGIQLILSALTELDNIFEKEGFLMLQELDNENINNNVNVNINKTTSSINSSKKNNHKYKDD